MAWEPNDLDLRANYDLGVEAGVAQERERIIKLLEEHSCDERAVHPYECNCVGFKHAIALIKGEEK